MSCRKSSESCRTASENSMLSQLDPTHPFKITTDLGACRHTRAGGTGSLGMGLSCGSWKLARACAEGVRWDVSGISRSCLGMNLGITYVFRPLRNYPSGWCVIHDDLGSER